MSGVVILGATGSIGSQALDVAGELGIPVLGLAARRGSAALLELVSRHPDAAVAVASPTPSEREALFEVGADIGADAVAALAATPGATIVNGIVGAAGLTASVEALRAGNRLALANKESLVAGGPVVLAAAAAGGGSIVPVDSEHSALFQLLAGRDRAEVERIVLTASGGPFRGWTAPELERVTPAQALQHPTWEMGPRITIDSATLMNKALEVIEAHHLFGFGYDDIGVIVHPQSLVHGLVELVDGSLLAHVGEPDMRIPIRYALTHPERTPRPASTLDLGTLTFEPPDMEAFPCLGLGFAAGRAGGSAPAVLNAADEIAVQAFLTERIGFSSIPVIVERTLADIAVRDLESVEDVLAIDEEARAVAYEHLGTSC